MGLGRQRDIPLERKLSKKLKHLRSSSQMGPQLALWAWADLKYNKAVTAVTFKTLNFNILLFQISGIWNPNINIIDFYR